MRTQEMMGALEAYFGERYTGIVRKITEEYLDGLSNSLRADLFQLAIRRVSRSFSKAPDVAFFEKHYDEAYERMVTPEIPLLEKVDRPTPEEQEEVARLIEEAKKTPIGRRLFGTVIPEPREPAQIGSDTRYHQDDGSNAKSPQVNRFNIAIPEAAR